MREGFDPVSQQLIQSLINAVNRSNGIVDGARLAISSHFAGSYVYASQACRRISHQALAPLQEKGLIDCAWHLKVLEDFDTLKHIEVPKGKAFLDYLGVPLQVDQVSTAVIQLHSLKCNVDWIDQKLSEISERWRVGARYLQLGPEHIDEVVVAAQVAQRLAFEPLRGRNIRALSLDWFNATDTLDKHRQMIALFCQSQIHPATKHLTLNDQLASLGLLHDHALMHLRGPFDAICDDDKLLNIGGWSGVAICAEFVRGFERDGEPPYVLTIENFTLYQRYLAAVQDGALVMFVSRFPCRRLLSIYQKLINTLAPATPLYHWGDIDFAGFQTVVALQASLSGREVKPFCMGVEQLRTSTQLGPTMGLNQLRKLAFMCKGHLRDELIDIASLPENLIRESPSEALPIIAPAALCKRQTT